MAERRMFAKTIIDSDAFLDMPLSAQALYFHLSMRADDEGFVNNPKKIQRMIGASDDDCRILIAKRFILTFESGVIVIKHWRIHNYIQKDRYKETLYKEEKSKLVLDEKNAYTEAEKEPCIQNGYNMDTQDRIGKVRLGKDNSVSKDTLEDIVELFNRICVSLPQVKKLTETRKRTLKNADCDDWEALFLKVEASDFLTGRNGDWKASFDWIIQPRNLIKITEGNYDNTVKKSHWEQTQDILKEWLNDTENGGGNSGDLDCDFSVL